MSAPAAVLDKIARLLRLAENAGATVHEAAAAAGAAAKLMAEHRLERGDLEGAEAEAISDADAPLFVMGRRVRWVCGLASGIARTQGCRSYVRVVDVYDPDRRDVRRRSELKLVGRKSDIESARYLFAYLHREIERLCSLARRRREIERGRVATDSFRVGAAYEVLEKLRAARTEAERGFAEEHGKTAATRAIVRVDERDAEVQRWMKERLELKSAPKFRGGSGDAEAAEAGRRAGRAIEIRRGIDGEHAPRELKAGGES